MFSGAEDLTPFLKEKKPGHWEVEAFHHGEIHIKRYRPRIEGGFARIERIKHPVLGLYWKVTGHDNATTIFGRNPRARIADPQNPSRIHTFIPCLYL